MNIFFSFRERITKINVVRVIRGREGNLEWSAQFGKLSRSVDNITVVRDENQQILNCRQYSAFVSIKETLREFNEVLESQRLPIGFESKNRYTFCDDVDANTAILTRPSGNLKYFCERK